MTRNLTEYHKSIGLNITMYHLDSGWWHSAHADGHCDGVTASNWSASQFHWPHTTGPDGKYGDGLSTKVLTPSNQSLWPIKIRNQTLYFKFTYLLISPQSQGCRYGLVLVLGMGRTNRRDRNRGMADAVHAPCGLGLRRRPTRQ